MILHLFEDVFSRPFTSIYDAHLLFSNNHSYDRKTFQSRPCSVCLAKHACKKNKIEFLC